MDLVCFQKPSHGWPLATGWGMRVRVREQNAPKDTPGKVVVVPSSFAELLLICGRKLGVRATQLFLSDGCEIEELSEVRWDDWALARAKALTAATGQGE
jgi:hypothetical protein